MLLLQSLYFSRPPPPHQSYNPRHPPLGTFDNQDVAVTVRRGISKRSHEKIGDCEQSTAINVEQVFIQERLNGVDIAFQISQMGHQHTSHSLFKMKQTIGQIIDIQQK